jgi:hypothetical protein
LTFRLRFSLLAAAALALCGVVVSASGPPPTANSQPILHGIAFLKGCNSPVVIGEMYTCDVLTINNVSTNGETVDVLSITDVVHAAAGDVFSGELLPTLTLGFAGGAFCNIGQTICTLPEDASIFTTASFGFYFPVETDPNPLTDTATLIWESHCDKESPNCPIGPQSTTAGSSAELQTPTPTPTPTPTDTPTPTATHTFTPTATPTPSNGAKMFKDTHGNVGTEELGLANVWLCEGATCDPEKNQGILTFTEYGFSGQDPIAAFEVQIKFDHKIFTTPPTFELSNAVLNDSRKWVDDSDPDNIVPLCFTNVTENYINIACVSVANQAPIEGTLFGPNPIPLLHVTFKLEGDLKFRMTPGNNNGIVRVILDENCELIQWNGHAVAGSVGGGLTTVCGNLAVTVRILEGDLNLDCAVDTTDAQMIASRYGAVFGLHTYDPWFDLEPDIKDFDIDAKDLQKVFGRLGNTCDNPPDAEAPVVPPQANL